MAQAVIVTKSRTRARWAGDSAHSDNDVLAAVGPAGIVWRGAI